MLNQKAIGGTLYIADFSRCEVKEADAIANLFNGALINAKVNAIPNGAVFHVFDNGALSASVLLQESHAAIHTWPEVGFVTFELFCCGESSDPMAAINFLDKTLGCKSFTVDKIERNPNEVDSEEIKI